MAYSHVLLSVYLFNIMYHVFCSGTPWLKRVLLPVLPEEELEETSPRSRGGKYRVININNKMRFIIAASDHQK